MELSRIKVLYGGLILQLLFTIAVPLPYNKYGRQCSDIGCLSSQVCVMAYDSCSLSQREGNDCGRYPTCKKNTEAGLAAGPSGVLSLNPAPENTKSKDTVYPNIPIDPNYIFGNVQTTKSPFFSHQPYPPPQPGLGSLPSVFQPMYPPLNQPPAGAQVPIAFGASPQNPYYPPRPQNPATSTEPSLWNQFLYNKQPDKRPRNGAALPSLRSSSLATVLLASAAVLLTNIQRYRGQSVLAGWL